MDGHDDLQAIVDAARAGDVDAQAQLFDRYHVAVYRYAFARLRSAPDAEDVAAETFVSALQAMPRFRWRGIPFEAWLFRIARSKVVDVVRRRSRAAQVHVRVDDLEIATSDDDPHAAAAVAERQAGLARALDRLPDAQRDVVVLRFILGGSIRHTAAALGRTEGAVKQLQLRALANLRREVDR
jgi:RNA polymerase sigma-70 factor, ECF subfamily